MREQKNLPLLRQFQAWLIKSEQQVLPKTKLGAAIIYCLNQWGKLNTFTKDDNVNIDNNRTELAIKSFMKSERVDAVRLYDVLARARRRAKH